MAKIAYAADKAQESTEGGGGSKYPPKVRGFYWLQIMEASDGKVTSDQAKNPGVPMTNFRMEVADEGDQQGAYVYHSVTWLPPMKDGKPNPGHGMAVHFLHATKMPYDGKFTFDEQDFLDEKHSMIEALLEVEPYTNSKGYENESYKIREIYTDDHPRPDKLPEPPKARTARPPAKSGAAAASSAARKTVDPEQGW